MKRVLITGANGFLGAHLARHLYRQGYELRLLVRANACLGALEDIPCQLVTGAIDRKEDIWEAVAGCQIVVHAAAITDQWGITYRAYEKVNFDATKEIAEACLCHQVEKLVYVSTANTIGPGTKQRPGTELNSFTLFTCNSGYINTKFLAQQYLLEQQQRRGLPVLIVNPTFMIGANDRKPSSGKLLLHCLQKRIVLCPAGGKNFVHIEDVCCGIGRAIVKGTPGHMYLLAGENMSYKEFFRLAGRLAGRKAVLVQVPGVVLKLFGYLGTILEKVFGRRSKLNYTTACLASMHNYYSGKKSERELGLHYRPVAKAVSEALDWFKENNYY